MSDLSLGAATTKFRSGHAGEAPRRPKKLERMSSRTAIGVMEGLKPIILDLIESKKTIVDPRSGSEMTVGYISVTGNLLAATVLEGLVAETGLKLLYELDHPSNLASEIHDLDRLFDELSPDTQARLENEYRERVQEYSSSSLSEDLNAVLTEHAKMFILWRYMYEGGPSGPGYSGELMLAIEAMIDLARELAPETASPSSGLDDGGS